MLKRLWPYLKPLWLRLTTGILCMAAVAGITTALMWLLKYLVDHALIDKDVDALKTGVVLILSGFALKSILWYSHTYLTAYVGHFISRKIRDDVYRHLYTLSMGFFNEKASARILSRLTNDVTYLQRALATVPTTVIRDGLTILGLIGFLLYTNLKFTLICSITLPFAALFLVSFGKKSRKASREGQAKMSDIYNTIQEALSAMPIVKTFQNEKQEIKHFSEENLRFFNIIMKLVRIEARSSPVLEFLGAIFLAVLIIFGGRDVIKGIWTTGDFMAFTAAAMSLYTPIKKFAQVNIDLQQGMAASERIFELMDENGTVVDNPAATPLPPLKNAIVFDNVSFAYQNDNIVLDSVNLTIKKGDIIALVGASGSGKTTLAQLLLRFYDPLHGAILFDGKDIREATLWSLRHQMAVVTQETHLFNDSIRANIGYGKENATQTEIEEAAKSAFAHDFIKKFPNGYDTVIGERGSKLSGGERQRIAIARSLLKNPAILILDEATSALDAASEQAVQLAFDRLLEGRTVLMIAHRLSTVRKADRIVVLDQGRIQEMGTHEELLSQKGRYHRLYSMQTLA